MTDVLGRSWQMGTIQLDSQMPARFGLTYMGADNAEHTPYVVHRALLGSLERFLGILIEHYAGDFPLWLAPVQVRVIPVGESHRAAAEDIRTRLAEAGARADVDERDETVSKRIRDAELEKIPRVVVYGDKESDAALAVRERGGGQETRSLDELIGELATPLALLSRSGTVPHLPSSGLRGGSTESQRRGIGAACVAVSSFNQEDRGGLVTTL